jgi:hypothetical protein
MDALDTFMTTPFGGMLTLPEVKQNELLELFFQTPASVRKVLASSRTGAYLRGVTKTFNLSLDVTPRLALTVFRIGVGLLPLPQLASVLASDLSVAPQVAQKIALELERELFAPIMLDLSRAKPSNRPTNTFGARNVLDLKKDNPPYPLPPRPR